MTSSDATSPGQFDLAINGGEVVLPAGVRRLNIGVRDGKVVALTPPNERLTGPETVDATGLTILPGLFDMHVHFREPGHTHKEDFASGTAAAAVGGFTAVADMPNTVPPTTSAQRLADKHALANGRAHVDFALWGGAGTPDRVAELAAAGAVGIKVYLGLETAPDTHSDAPAELAVADDAALYRIMEAAAEEGILVAVHCANRALRDLWRRHWRGHGFPELKASIAAEPQLHKVEAITRTLLLAAALGTRLHIVHVPAPALDHIRRAKDAGIAVTAEAALPFMTHELLDTAAELGFDRYRSSSDADALWQAARDGTVDVLATDHAPHTLAEKRTLQQDLLAGPSGYPELDTALPMLLDAVNRGVLGLCRLAELLGAAPAAILDIEGKGSIALGRDADVVVVDTRRTDLIRAERLQTKGGWSPYEGRELTGWPVATYLRGVAVAENGLLTGTPAAGRFLPGKGAAAPRSAAGDELVR